MYNRAFLLPRTRVPMRACFTMFRKIFIVFHIFTSRFYKARGDAAPGFYVHVSTGRDWYWIRALNIQQISQNFLYRGRMLRFCIKDYSYYIWFNVIIYLNVATDTYRVYLKEKDTFTLPERFAKYFVITLFLTKLRPNVQSRKEFAAESIIITGSNILLESTLDGKCWSTILSKLLTDYRSEERLSTSEGNQKNRINVISSRANSYAYSREYFSNRNIAAAIHRSSSISRSVRDSYHSTSLGASSYYWSENKGVALLYRQMRVVPRRRREIRDVRNTEWLGGIPFCLRLWPWTNPKGKSTVTAATGLLKYHSTDDKYVKSVDLTECDQVQRINAYMHCNWVYRRLFDSMLRLNYSSKIFILYVNIIKKSIYIYIR